MPILLPFCFICVYFFTLSSLMTFIVATLLSLARNSELVGGPGRGSVLLSSHTVIVRAEVSRSNKETRHLIAEIMHSQ